jgi:hypothetical protein
VHFGLAGDEAELSSEIALEETMVVCYALANLCQTAVKYAERVFDNGLLSIMLPLIKSRNFEVGRQALRCVSRYITL